MELKELILGLRGLILSLRGLILGLRGLILGLRGLILGLRGLIWGLRGASGGGTYVRTYGRTYGRLEIHPCVLQDIGPLGPLPKKGLVGQFFMKPPNQPKIDEISKFFNLTSSYK